MTVKCGSFLLLLVLAAVPATAQQLRRRCTGEPPDSSALQTGPVYRDCEVDRPARLRTGDLPVDFTPPAGNPGSGRCYRAEFQFVVDTTGRPEPLTVRPGRSNDRGLEDALRGSLDQLRYEPARLANRRVRQVVIYSRAVAPIVRVSPDEERTGLPAVRSSANCP
jgi:hypothetical protein